MQDLSQALLQFSPKLRDQKEGETTPEYLNYINKKINLTHEEILKFSPFYRISVYVLSVCFLLQCFNVAFTLFLKKIYRLEKY